MVLDDVGVVDGSLINILVVDWGDEVIYIVVIVMFVDYGLLGFLLI